MRLPRHATLPLLVALLAAPPPVGASWPPPQRGTGGAVSSAEPLATEAGLVLLEAGGNAVDAAVAVALALAVVEPQAGNLGGGGFAVIRMDGRVRALDFRETAPAAARPDLFLDARGEPVPDASTVGPLAAGVPGSPAGLFELHRAHGRLPWARVVAPAERLARVGFPVSRQLAEAVAGEREVLGRFPETAATWLPGGEPPAPGTRLRLPALARTLRALARRGPGAVTTGTVADAVVAASERHGGVLTAADLAAYRPEWREPVRFEAFGWQVASMPLPSSGGVLLATISALLEARRYPELPRAGADRAHLLAEAWRRAYADRFLLGDPATTAVAPQALLSPARLAQLAFRLPADRATPSADTRPGEFVSGFEPPSPAGPPAPERSETTHLSVLDAEGNAVALTTTLNGWFGCGLFVPEAGFFLNNEMDDFAIAPGRPNMFGLVQGEANAVAPGKRMLSSMSPTVAWRGEEVVVLGAPGGSRIPTGTLQVLLNVILDGDDLATAIGRPRLHHQWLPDRLDAEPGALSPETAAELRRRGHELGERDAVGRVNAVRLRADGVLEAAADPRGGGAASVVDLAPGTTGTSLEPVRAGLPGTRPGLSSD